MFLPFNFLLWDLQFSPNLDYGFWFLIPFTLSSALFCATFLVFVTLDNDELGFSVCFLTCSPCGIKFSMFPPRALLHLRADAFYNCFWSLGSIALDNTNWIVNLHENGGLICIPGRDHAP